MYGLQDVLLRTSIVLGMVAAVVTILYFTPTPGKEKVYFKWCFIVYIYAIGYFNYIIGYFILLFSQKRKVKVNVPKLFGAS